MINDSKLLCTLKKHFKFKSCEIGKFSNSKYVFKISRFQKSFITCKWGVMYITYKTKVVTYDIENQSLK
jgi:hypothetical protein